MSRFNDFVNTHATKHRGREVEIEYDIRRVHGKTIMHVYVGSFGNDLQYKLKKHLLKARGSVENCRLVSGCLTFPLKSSDDPMALRTKLLTEIGRIVCEFEAEEAKQEIRRARYERQGQKKAALRRLAAA